MPSTFTRVILFFSSYSPLILIFCILLWGKQSVWVIVGLLVFVVLILIITVAYFRTMKRRLPTEHKRVKRVERRDTEVMGYIATYLIPFVTFPLDSLQQLLALIVFLGVLLLVYVQSNMIYINPLLNLFGFHLYEVEVESGPPSCYYIAHKRVVAGEPIDFVPLSDDIYLEK